ncbi:MAG: sulfatase-like hydrolase/transferase [Acidobacteria bacterium]|nr:sulfatase-like hydrolase/transferase [Acidobacteriota bacterium]
MKSWVIAGVAILTAPFGCQKRHGDLVQYRASAPLILISIDTLRADHLPAYGYTQVETPAIDQFSKEAVVFERCYSHCPQTLPSHSSILTGLLPFEHGVRDNIGFFIKDGQATLASVLQREGFTTGGFVSSYVLRTETKVGLGFDSYDAEMTREKAEVSFGELQRKGELTIEAARTWLGTQQPGKRFFLFLHLYEPHTPYQPPEPYASRYAGRPYDGEIAHVDALVGSFLQTLKDRGLYQRALIIITSDHGEGLGDHGEGEHGVFLYNEDIHVPLMIRYPEGIRAGEKVETPVQHVDLLPTVLDFYGLTPLASSQGRSILLSPLKIPERAIYSESLYPLYHFGWSELYSLTDSRHKFIKSPREELYDLGADPGEKSNIATSSPTIAGQYRYQVDQTIANRTVESPAEMSPEDMERLQALGYIGVASSQVSSQQQKPDPKDKIHLIEKYRRGLHLHRQGDEAGAAAVFREIILESPDMADVLEQLGRSLARLKRVDEAAPVLRRVAELRWDNAFTLIGVSRIFWKLKMHPDALKCVDHALSLNPTIARGFELKGQILFSANDITGALTAFDRALALDGTLPMPYYIEGIVALQRGKADEALRLFRRAESELAKKEKHLVLPALHYNIGFLLERKGLRGDAQSEYRMELTGMPSTYQARIRLAALLVQEGRREEAVKLFENHRGRTREAVAAMATFLQSIGEQDRARTLSAEAQRLP